MLIEGPSECILMPHLENIISCLTHWESKKHLPSYQEENFGAGLVWFILGNKFHLFKQLYTKIYVTGIESPILCPFWPIGPKKFEWKSIERFKLFSGLLCLTPPNIYMMYPSLNDNCVFQLSYQMIYDLFACKKWANQNGYESEVAYDVMKLTLASTS